MVASAVFMEQGSNDHEFTAGTVVAGRLRILRRLGMGGMGSVYEVEHELTRHRRALKLLHAQMAQIPSVVERFLREASAAGRIGNPHIVETFDAGRLESGEPYIVMELLQGKSLAEILSDEGPLAVDAAIDVLLQACDAIAAAHSSGIVHRDLKPENLFLCGPQRDFVKILDFGISKFDANTTGVEVLTLEGAPLGTPYYMSPEQVQGEKTLDGRTDVYALGILLYECLTGQKPFVSDTLPHLVVLIFQGNYTPASELRHHLPKAIDDVIAKAMARDRHQRFATAQELAAALRGLRSTDTRVASAISDAPHGFGDGQSDHPQPPRSTPALTPDVFSRPAWIGHPAGRAPETRRRNWLAAAMLTAGVLVVGVSYRWWSVYTTQPVALHPASYSAIPSASPTGAASSPVGSIDVLPLKLVEMQGVSSAPTISSSRPTRPATVLGPSVANAKVDVTPAPSVAPRGKNRANSYGLTEKNPFD